MPRNILFPREEQQNVLPIKLSQGSRISTMSQEDILMESCWKTNLMIVDQGQRIKRIDKGSRKNTSFQNKIINDHVWAVIKTVCQMAPLSSINEARQICKQIEGNENYFKQGIKQERFAQLFDKNMYLTESEKSEIAEKFRFNFQNYQILIKLIARLKAVGQYREELIFIIVKIVDFITANYQLKYRKYDEKFLTEQVLNRLCSLTEWLVGHQNIRVINPEYFYNFNQQKYMKIIQVCFYSIFSIKLGLTDNKYLAKQQSGMELE